MSNADNGSDQENQISFKPDQTQRQQLDANPDFKITAVVKNRRQASPLNPKHRQQ